MSREAENPVPRYAQETPLGTLRRALGLSLVQVGEMVDMNNSRISRIESGLSRPSYGAAEKLSAAFGGVITELHLIYPSRFIGWLPTDEQLVSLEHLMRFAELRPGRKVKASASEAQQKSVSAL